MSQAMEITARLWCLLRGLIYQSHSYDAEENVLTVKAISPKPVHQVVIKTEISV